MMGRLCHLENNGIFSVSVYEIMIIQLLRNPTTRDGDRMVHQPSFINIQLVYVLKLKPDSMEKHYSDKDMTSKRGGGIMRNCLVNWGRFP